MGDKTLDFERLNRGGDHEAAHAVASLVKLWLCSFKELFANRSLQISACFCFVALCRCNACQAQGDYQFAIDGEYDFIRCNSTETVVCKGSRVVFSPLDYPQVGPIVNYALTTDSLLLKTVGRKRVSPNPRNTFEGADKSRTFFFVLDRVSDSVTGPLDESEFLSKIQIESQQIQWQRVSKLWLAVFFLTILVLFLLVGVILMARKRPFNF